MRTALMTGRYQYRLVAGLEEPINLESPKNAGLPPSHPTKSLYPEPGACRLDAGSVQI